MSDDRTRCVTTACQIRAEGPQPAQARKVLCLDCERDLRRHVRDIAADWAAAHRSLRPGSSGDGEKVGGSRGAPIPVDVDVADILRRTRSDVWFVVRMVYDERELTDVDAGDRSVPALCRWLARPEREDDEQPGDHLGWLAGHKDAALVQGVCDDLAADAQAVSWATVPLRARRVEIQGLRCTEHGTSDMGERVECGGTLYALVGARDGLPDLRCSHDRSHVIDPATWTSRGFNRHLDRAGMLNLRRAVVGS